VNENALDSTDLVLLLLWAPTRSTALRNSVPGITRLEKLLYLLDREASVGKYVDEPFEFRPYDLGPYSRQVYEAVEVLEAADLLREELVYSGRDIDMVEGKLAGIDEEPEGTERRFYLTEDGEKVAALLAKQAPKPLLEALTNSKDTYGPWSLRRLIHYVYTRYPESAAKSRIRDEVLGQQ
jgi:hypothetical protein